MRGPAYTEEETAFIAERIQAGASGTEIVSAFMERTRSNVGEWPGFPSGRTVDAVTQKVRKAMLPKHRPSARAKHTAAQPVRNKANGAEARLEILGVTITGPEQNVLAVAKQLA